MGKKLSFFEFLREQFTSHTNLCAHMTQFVKAQHSGAFLEIHIFVSLRFMY